MKISFFQGHEIIFTDDADLPDSEWRKIPLPAGPSSVTLTDLTPDTVYFIYARAINAFGPGRLSHLLVVNTSRFDPCENFGCSHLCNVNEETQEPSCSCEPEMKLAEDKKNCVFDKGTKSSFCLINSVIIGIFDYFQNVCKEEPK